MVVRAAGSPLSLVPLPPPFGSDLVPHCVFPVTGAYTSLDSTWSPEYYLLPRKMEAQAVERQPWILCEGCLGLSDRMVASLEGSPEGRQGKRLDLGGPLGLEVKLGALGSFQQAGSIVHLNSKETEKVQLPLFFCPQTYSPALLCTNISFLSTYCVPGTLVDAVGILMDQTDLSRSVLEEMALITVLGRK